MKTDKIPRKLKKELKKVVQSNYPLWETKHIKIRKITKHSLRRTTLRYKSLSITSYDLL
jgi:hypothetical protein